MVSRIALAFLVITGLFGAVFGVRAWNARTWFDDAALTVWVFDVGQGDAIFIDGPERQVLIDGGPDTAVLEKLGEVLPPWDRTLDVVIASHLHADHAFGLNAVVERYAVGEVYVNGVYTTPPAEALLATVDEQPFVAGTHIDLGNGAVLEALWPESAAEDSGTIHDTNIVLLLRYGDTTMLLTGDAEAEHETAFMAGLPPIDILKVGHHGSDTSTSYTFLNIIHPAAAIISVGEGNSYGHPSPLVVGRLTKAGTVVFRTDTDGDIRVFSRGGEPTVTSFPQ